MNSSEVFLRFTENGQDRFCSFADFLHAGHPIDPDTGEDLEQYDDLVYVKRSGRYVAILGAFTKSA